MYLILLLLLFEPFFKYIIPSINIRIPYRLLVISLFISLQIHGNFQIIALLGWISILKLIYDYGYELCTDNEIIENV
jgi:hypothetical protein